MNARRASATGPRRPRSTAASHATAKGSAPRGVSHFQAPSSATLRQSSCSRETFTGAFLSAQAPSTEPPRPGAGPLQTASLDSPGPAGETRHAALKRPREPGDGRLIARTQPPGPNNQPKEKKMKRIKLLGLALLALFALSAVASSVASAELPEILPVPTAGTPATFTAKLKSAAAILSSTSLKRSRSANPPPATANSRRRTTAK